MITTILRWVLFLPLFAIGATIIQVASGLAAEFHIALSVVACSIAAPFVVVAPLMVSPNREVAACISVAIFLALEASVVLGAMSMLVDSGSLPVHRVIADVFIVVGCLAAASLAKRTTPAKSLTPANLPEHRV